MRTSLKLLAASAVALAAMQAAPALAQDAETPAVTVTGNVALVTDYRFRGVSLSGGDPAIQGGITLNMPSGFYLGTWSSSIDDGGSGLYGEQELDLFGGWTGELTPGLTADVGLLKYVYPTNDHGPADYWEPYASLSTQMGPAKAKFGVAYAWEQKSLGNDDNLYLFTNVDVGVPSTPLTVSGHVGYTDGVLAPPFLAGRADKTGFDWSVGASATAFDKLTFGVSYIDTEGPSINNFTDSAIVGSVSVAF